MGLELETAHKELDFIFGTRGMEGRGTGTSCYTSSTSNGRESKWIYHASGSCLEGIHVRVKRSHVET